MREIKFRAWDKKEKIMINKNNNFINISELVSLAINEDLSGYVLMQFTGLKDKKGKEIYEGDIIEWVEFCSKDDLRKCWNKIKEPLDRDNYANYYFRDVVEINTRFWLKNEDFGYEGEELVEPSDCKVIGNVYENPELIKEKK